MTLAIAWPPAAAGESRGPIVATTGACEFVVQPIYQTGAPVYVLGVGEIDPARGKELIAVEHNGTIHRLSPPALGEGQWTVEPLPITVEPLPPGTGMTERPTINIADVHPGFAGNEIILKTYSIVQVLVQTSPGQWLAQVVFDGSQFLGLHWGVRTGDIDPAQPGDELFYIFEGILDTSTGHYARLVGDEWVSQTVYSAEVGMDSAIGDSNPAWPGNEIIVGTEMGPVYEIASQPDNPELWQRRTLWDDSDNAPWTLRIADMLPDEPGNEIVYGTRGNNRVLLSRENSSGTGHDVEVLFTGQPTGTSHMNMWDIAVGDLVPSSPSLEIVGVDDLGRTYLVQHDGVKWSGQTLWQDQSGLYATVMADFLPDSPGLEIVVTGQSGAITLISRHEPAPGDVTCDGAVNVDDVVAVILAWGPCPAPPAHCPADLDHSGAVNVDDLINVILNWT